MSANDLTVPLSAPAKPRRAHYARFVAPALFGVSVCLLATVAGWILLVDDPTGGEPIAYAKIERPAASAPPVAVTEAAQKAETAGANSAESPAADGPASTKRTEGASSVEEQSGVTVVRSGGASAPNAVIITAPDEAPRQIVLGEVVPALLEKSRHGDLPKIAANGQKPLDVYARPVVIPPGIKSKNPPKIAILVGGMGISTTGTASAIKRLPPAVTLAFAPYGDDLLAKVKSARVDGHEVMLQAPMEPFDYPDNDPGPQTLLSGASLEQNADRLRWQLSRFQGFVGVTNYMGAEFTADPAALAPMLEELAKRGLMFADDGSSPRSQVMPLSAAAGLPAVMADVVIDAEPTAAAIDGALAKLEQTAKDKGQAFGVATGLPLTIERVADFAKLLEARGIVLVPVSALVRQ